MLEAKAAKILQREYGPGGSAANCSVVAEIEPGTVLRDAVLSGLGVTVLPLTATRAHFRPR
ncbi:hypothetical protein [Streptomyces javensis]|uniref:LysR substrate-binding domain-containing protein n=1 Tax=Streptomyces javensis TaxID=114698 RepID=A0ABS0R8K4_9ACTN|nr:hypothetical protein [Streptomyces javensis]MBI0313709.1 hypothetical protein [Streptomyces javensis]